MSRLLCMDITCGADSRAQRKPAVGRRRVRGTLDAPVLPSPSGLAVPAWPQPLVTDALPFPASVGLWNLSAEWSQANHQRERTDILSLSVDDKTVSRGSDQNMQPQKGEGMQCDSSVSVC